MIMKYASCGVDVRDQTLCENKREKCCKHSKCSSKDTGVILADGLMEAFKLGFTSLVGIKIGVSCKDTRKNLIRSLKTQPDLGILSLRALDDNDIRSLSKVCVLPQICMYSACLDGCHSLLPILSWKPDEGVRRSFGVVKSWTRWIFLATTLASRGRGLCRPFWNPAQDSLLL